MMKSVVPPSEEDELFTLPQELISEILSWLDVDSLLRFKTVCKSWRSLIEEHTFILAHHSKSIIQSVFDDPLNYDGLSCLSSDCGVVLEYDSKANIYSLRNPSTKKTLELPDPGQHVLSMNMYMCLVHSPPKFKLAVPCNELRKRDIFFRVFTVGTDVAWRDIRIPFPSADVMVQETIIENKVYYMLCLSEGGHEVICLGMEDEKISRIEIPITSFPIQLNAKLLHGGDRPAVGCVVEDEVHIWSLEDGDDDDDDDDQENNIITSWAEKKIIVPLKFVPHRPEGVIYLSQFSEHGLSLSSDWTEEILLDVPSGKIKWRFRAPQGKEFDYHYYPSLMNPKGC